MPGSTRLAVIAATPNVTLETMDTDVSNVHSWVGPFGAEPLAWSPDGTKILVATDTEVRIYDDVPNGGYSTIDTTSNGTVTSLDWIGNIWALVHAKDMGTTIPASVAATAPVGSAGFSDLFTPVAVPGTTPTQYQPIAGDIRIRPDGTVAWDGQVSWGATAQHGIFTGSGTFQLNTGPTQSFAFSPDGNEVVAARSGNVDVVSWSGPVRAHAGDRHGLRRRLDARRHAAARRPHLPRLGQPGRVRLRRLGLEPPPARR